MNGKAVKYSPTFNFFPYFDEVLSDLRPSNLSAHRICKPRPFIMADFKK